MSSESLANVAHLQVRKPDAVTYRDFYDLYGAAREGAAILLNRVLHIKIDETSNNTTHLIIEQGSKPGGYMVPILGNPNNSEPVYKVGYDPRKIRIATTDGETISTYHTRSVQGIYWGHINKVYNSAYEQLQVNFVSSDREEGRVDFNLATGIGSFMLGNRVLGEVLDAPQSESLRYAALYPDSIPPIQGTVAS